MPPRKEKRTRAEAARNRRPRGAAAGRERLYEPARVDEEADPDALTPREHYQRERARRAQAQRDRGVHHPLEEARRAYEALLAAEAESRRGGRPRKIVSRRAGKTEGEAPDEETPEE